MVIAVPLISSVCLIVTLVFSYLFSHAPHSPDTPPLLELSLQSEVPPKKSGCFENATLFAGGDVRTKAEQRGAGIGGTYRAKMAGTQGEIEPEYAQIRRFPPKGGTTNRTQTVELLSQLRRHGGWCRQATRQRRSCLMLLDAALMDLGRALRN